MCDNILDRQFFPSDVSWTSVPEVNSLHGASKANAERPPNVQTDIEATPQVLTLDCSARRIPNESHHISAKLQPSSCQLHFEWPQGANIQLNYIERTLHKCQIWRFGDPINIQFSISAGASQADRKKLDASRALSFGVHASSVILLNAGPNDTLLPLKGIG